MLSNPISNHAYGIELIAVPVCASASVVFYTSFYLPESLTKPSIYEKILELQKVPYHYRPHPCMKGEISVEKSRF